MSKAAANVRVDQPEIVLIQAAIGDYRQSFLDQVFDALGNRLLVMTGPVHFVPSLITGARIERKHDLSNHFFAGRRLMVQSGGLLRRALLARTAVIELNPRILSVWLLATLRRLLGLRTIGWGHAFPRRGPQARTDSVRSIMRRLCGEIMVYTYQQQRDLAAREPGLTIHVVPNATQPTVAPVRGSRSGVVYCGRFAEEKRLSLLVESFARAVARGLPRDCVLTLVGDGPERDSLEKLAAELGITDQIEFPGRISDVTALSEIYAASLLSVSPGYVGLALTQSLAFGVPMIIADDEPHAPEVELANDDNSVLFAARDADALASCLLAQFARREDWVAATEAISARTQSLYSSEAMAAAFVRVVS